MRIQLSAFFGFNSDVGSEPARWFARVGVVAAGFFAYYVGSWGVGIRVEVVREFSLVLVGFGIALMALPVLHRKLSFGQANVLTLVGHLAALFAFYVFTTRFTSVVYATDSIIGTYMGVVKTLGLSDPYTFSIKPFLDLFGLPPSAYTPRVDGSFEFHLNYPAANFLSFVPFYMAGLHDLRDGVLIFHIVSLAIIFGAVPTRYKTMAIAPFIYYFPSAVAGSLTDSLWALELLLAALLWYRNRKGSFALVGLAVASKQIAILALPFLLIRNWNESDGPQFKSLAKAFGSALLGFGIPNLPFLIISPHDWWISVVTPYLPNATPQVMAGVGLSNFLISMGFNPPSFLFFALMGLSFGVLLCMYARWTGPIRGLVWIFPPIVLLFYPRSFPNYLAYWAFPLVLEMFTNVKARNFHFPTPQSPLPRFQLPTFVSRYLHGGMVPSFLLSIVITGALVGVSGAYLSKSSNYNVLVKVNGLRDPDSLGAATLMTVTLANIGTEPVSPRFFVKWSPQPFLWDNLNSTGPLLQGTNANYTLSTSDALAAIPVQTSFRVWVFDAKTSQLVGQSLSTVVGLAKPSIINPYFRWWTLDPSTGKRLPFGWLVTVSNTDLGSSGVRQLSPNATSGVNLVLNYTSTTSGVASISLAQFYNNGNMTLAGLVVQKDFATVINQPGTAIFGAAVSDGSHLLDIIFSDKAAQETTRTFSQNTTIVYPLQTSSWASLSLDLPKLWTDQSWTSPKQFSLSLFIETTEVGIYTVQVAQAQGQSTSPISLP